MRKYFIIIILVVSIVINPIIINAQDMDKSENSHSESEESSESSKILYACLYQSGASIVEGIMAVIPILYSMSLCGMLSNNSLTTFEVCLAFFIIGVYALSVPVFIFIYGRMTAEKIHNIIKYKRSIEPKSRKNGGR